MPSSHWQQINEVVDGIMRVNPQSMLDIGVGFGKYGVLAREYLELWDGRNVYYDWKRQIDGIEGFQGYKNPIHYHVYSHVYYGDALSILPTLGHYDLIILIDVLEHFTQNDGRTLLSLCKSKGKRTLVATPRNPSAQGSVFGNSYESHISQWSQEELEFFLGHGNIIPNIKSLIWLSN